MKISKKILEKIKDYFSKKGGRVVAVYLYGSFARGEAEKDSDIDLGVLMAKPLRERPFAIPQVILAQKLSLLLAREVEIQDLEACRLDFAHRVLAEGELIYCRNEKERIKFEEGIFRNFFDLKPSFDEYYYYLSEITKKGELGVRYL